MKKKTVTTLIVAATISGMVLWGGLFYLVNTPMWQSEEFRKRMGWQSYGRENHGTYHDCDWNRDIILAAKGAFVKARHLTNGTPVTAEDIAPFLTNSPYYFPPKGGPVGSLPRCPSGGTYSINPVGSNIVCSHPYHQWYNCMHKTSRHQ